MVQIPQSYLEHIQSKLIEVRNAIPEINRYVGIAKRVEREYMHLACNGKHEIKGLDSGIATKICSWRDELRPMYLAAIERSKKQLEQQLDAVEKSEKERMLKEKIALQQVVIGLQGLQNRQQEWKEINNSINNLSYSLQNSAMQTQQMMQYMPVYQPFQPASIGSTGRINCITNKDRS